VRYTNRVRRSDKSVNWLQLACFVVANSLFVLRRARAAQEASSAEAAGEDTAALDFEADCLEGASAFDSLCVLGLQMPLAVSITIDFVRLQRSLAAEAILHFAGVQMVSALCLFWATVESSGTCSSYDAFHSQAVWHAFTIAVVANAFSCCLGFLLTEYNWVAPARKIFLEHRFGRASQGCPPGEQDDGTSRAMECEEPSKHASLIAASATPPSRCACCIDAPATHAFVPCGHFGVCESCCASLFADTKDRACPICRAQLSFVLRIYNA